MCGFVGIASVIPVQRRAWLDSGCDALIHRGPDDAGTHWSADSRVGLAHRRLSIIDLSSAGHQPMRCLDRDLTIVFNGEIYNHRDLRRELESLGEKFQSLTDTEVILSGYRHWGMTVLDRLDGMFAFALYDGAKQRLLLARDRAGEKPLFYRLVLGEIRFASELKGILADPALPRRIDRLALDCYLTMGYVPGSLCMLEGFNKLEAASALSFDTGTGEVQHWRYWRLPEPPDSSHSPSLDALAEELEHKLEMAVQRQLVADVPVGLLLSGGVDSSLITAIAARLQPGIKTFTVGFQGYVDHDETQHAAAVARHFATDHQVLQANRVDLNILEHLARHYDEPIMDSSMIPTSLLCEQIVRHCKVAIGGDGGDELFGGYHTVNRMVWLRDVGQKVPVVLRYVGGKVAENLLPIGARGRTFLTHLASLNTIELPFFSTKFDQKNRRKLMRQIAHWDCVAEQIWQSRIPNENDVVQRVTRFEFANYLVEDILVKVDRASMMHSLEVRVPFLDKRVIDFAYGRVPASCKANHKARKIILRELAKRLLPPDFDSFRKQGFCIPLGVWLHQGPWRQHFETIFIDSHLPFDRSAICKLFTAVDHGRPVAEHLFGLVLLELWCRQFHVSFN